MHARHDPKVTTAAARAASPSSTDYWLTRTLGRGGKIEPRDPEQLRSLGEHELRRRAEHERQGWMQHLSMEAARKRRSA
jgi:hypothetical protein